MNPRLNNTKDTTMSKTKTTTTNPQALLALARLSHLNLASNAAVKELRGEVPPGKYKGETTFKLVYDLTVGEDHEAEVAQTVPWKAIAGALFGKLNAATRDKLVRELLESAEDGGFQVRDDAINEEAEEALKALMGTTRKTVSGKITGSAVVIEEN
jgi:hypothetical protein